MAVSLPFTNSTGPIVPLTGPYVTPYPDNRCHTPLANWSYDSRNGTTYTNQPFTLGAGVSAYNNSTLKGNYESYSDLTFSVPNNSDVYWKFSNLDKGCRAIFMRPYPQADHGTDIPGTVVLDAGDASACFYTSPGQALYMSFCCGYGDCAAFDVGVSSLDAQDAKDLKRSLPSVSTGGPASSVANVAFGSGSSIIKRDFQSQTSRALRGGSLSARAAAAVQGLGQDFVERDTQKCGDNDAACFDNAWGECTITQKGNKISMPGRQVAVSDFLPCGPVYCEIDQSTTTTQSSEVSTAQTDSDTTSTSSSQQSASTNTNTIQTTNKDGYSLSVGASVGWNLFSVSTDATTEHSTTNTNINTQTNVQVQSSSQSFSKTVSKTTGHALTDSKSLQTTSKFQIVPGGYAVLTFLPFYDCYPVEVDCGNPWLGPFGQTKTITTQICVPEVDTNNNTVGSFDLLYSNSGHS